MNIKFVEYVSDIKVNVASVGVYQTFYIVCTLTPNIVLGIPWVTKTRFDKNVLDKDCMNDRCIKSELTRVKGPEREYLAEIQKVNDKNLKGYSQEADCGKAMEKLEICGHDVVHDECKVDYNRIEAADSQVLQYIALGLYGWNNGLVRAVFGNHFEIRKLGRMDITLGMKLLGSSSCVMWFLVPWD
ncbi:hypothetical protein F8M41_020999 [Gigaspora margarita]|uniref:Uncharacterized protein n=1 Tax=Gigaspora margarita TaxID=4874 RepID=A0A8H4B555_GIGMA|nr:hypothetical protein F8M41_020999 [Gigaspora margarita]